MSEAIGRPTRRPGRSTLTVAAMAIIPAHAANSAEAASSGPGKRQPSRAGPHGGAGQRPTRCACSPTKPSRGAAIDDDLVAPLRTLRRLAMAGGKRLRPAFCDWGFRAAGGDPADEAAVDRSTHRRRLRAAARVRPGPRRRHGRLATPARPRPTAAHRVRRPPRRRGLAGRGAPLRRGRRHPRRRPRLRATPTGLMAGRRRPCSRRVARAARSSSAWASTSTSLGTARGERSDPAQAGASRGYKSGSTRSSGRCTSAPPLAAGRTARPTLRRRLTAYGAARSARRSSSATTCSACSATPRSPASRSATTCARASRRRCSPPPAPAGRRRRQRRAARSRRRRPTSTDDEHRAAAGGARRHRRARPRSRTRPSSCTVAEALDALERARRSPDEAQAALWPTSPTSSPRATV